MTIPFVGGNENPDLTGQAHLFGYIFGETYYPGSVGTLQYHYSYHYSSLVKVGCYYYIPSSLKSVTITGGNIHEGSFENCSGLTSITIRNGTTYIDDFAFSGCSALTSIEIPDKVTKIGGSAFSGCSALTSIHIPDSVTEIGGSAFSGCGSLDGIWVGTNNANYSSDAYGVLFNMDRTVLLQTPGGISCNYTVPDSVTTIESSVFFGCGKLTGVTIPDSVTSIGDSAFSYCSGLTSVTIPNGITSISHILFVWCYCDGGLCR